MSAFNLIRSVSVESVLASSFAILAVSFSFSCSSRLIKSAIITFSLSQVAFASAVTFLVSTQVISSSCVSLMVVPKEGVTAVVVASDSSMTYNSILMDMA